ncbi:MAG: hypothetical protein WC683_00415 [bacterium]
MTQCKSIQFKIDDESLLRPLVDAMKKAGVAEADLDSGYYQIDYANPGGRGAFAGAGDCVVEEREVLERALRDWRSLRAPLKTWLGQRLPWDYDPAPVEGDPELRIKYLAEFDSFARDVIAAIRADLAKQGLTPESDEYRSAMAEGLYYFLEFPEEKDWKRYVPAQRKKILSKMKRLDNLRLSGFKRLLTERGGIGNLYNYNADANTLSHYSYSVGVVPDFQSPKLYYLFEMAGLEPSLVEIMNVSSERFVCGVQMPITFGVGVELKSGWRTFDPAFHNPDAQRLPFYPLSLRQYVVSMSSGKDMIDAWLTKGGTDGDPSAFLSADGAALSLQIMVNAVGTLRDRQESAKVGDVSKFFLNNKKLIHPIVGAVMAFMGQTTNGVVGDYMKAIAEAVEAQGIIPPEYMDIMVLDLYMMRGKDAVGEKEAAASARSLLEVDPRCHMAHRFLAEAASRDPAGARDAETERHFAKAMQAIELDSMRRGELLTSWGWYELRMGREKKAREKLDIAYAEKDGGNIQQALAGWLLALLAARAGDDVGAALYLDTAVAFIADEISSSQNFEGSQKWAEVVGAQMREFPFPERSLASEKISTPVGTILFAVARDLLADGKSDEAIRIGRMAADLVPADRRVPSLMWLHEAHLQAGDVEGAKRVWAELRPYVQGGADGRGE